ncbi:MAG: DUF881 domain-containing protein [Bowdeniella nasicola]|nr:DUF881 domain-containing protein [Bowdeniella nasicola]
MADPERKIPRHRRARSTQIRKRGTRARPVPASARARARALRARRTRRELREQQVTHTPVAPHAAVQEPPAAHASTPAPTLPPPPADAPLPPSYPPPPKQPTGSAAWRHVLAGRSAVVVILCALLGFALILQVSQQPEESLSRMRQDDLVRLLDELGRRNEELTAESNVLQQRLEDLEAGAQDAQLAREAAAEQARARAILAGTAPVVGPGITLTIVETPGGAMTAQMMVTVLEELRNAGAEAIELNNHRISTSTWFRRDGLTLVVDGQELVPPYVFNAIGDPQKLATALDIPGGALATIRNANAKPTVTNRDRITITSVRTPPTLKYAKPEADN